MKRGNAGARRVLLRRLLSERAVASQDELVRLLARHGYQVTQTTVSRDLAALGVRKSGDRNGERYTLRRGAPLTDRRRDLARIMNEFVQAIDGSRNLVVLKTSAGAANPVAAALDRAALDGVLGTVAGDDTVLVVSRDDDGGAELARRLSREMESPR